MSTAPPPDTLDADRARVYQRGYDLGRAEAAEDRANGFWPSVTWPSESPLAANTATMLDFHTGLAVGYYSWPDLTLAERAKLTNWDKEIRNRYYYWARVAGFTQPKSAGVHKHAAPKPKQLKFSFI